MTRRIVSVGLAAGLLCPPFFAGAMVYLTLAQTSFLESSGWSPMRRNKVEWPSILTLGPKGWYAVATIGACGVLGGMFAMALHAIAQTKALRLTGGLMFLMACGVCLVAFRPDPVNTTGPASWHDTIHNAAYPAIVLLSIGAMCTAWVGARTLQRWRVVTYLSIGALAISLPALILAAAEPVAQFARYGFFGPLLVWLEGLALTAVSNRPAT